MQWMTKEPSPDVNEIAAYARYPVSLIEPFYLLSELEGVKVLLHVLHQ